MNKGHLGQAALAGGIVCIILVAWALMNGHAPTQEEYAAQQFQKHTGLSGKTLLLLLDANRKIRARQFTEDDWSIIDKYSKSEAIEFRVTAGLALGGLKGTMFEDRATKVLYNLAEDTDPPTRLMAIKTLCRMKDGQAEKFLRLARSSNIEYLKTEAEKVATHISQGQMP